VLVIDVRGNTFMVVRTHVVMCMSGAGAVVMAGRFDGHVAVRTDTQHHPLRRVDGGQYGHHHHRQFAKPHVF